ncbi:hypothetical protein SBA4_4650013 [Candidatus Sulfopaludibacter sp. SbA4]|nr:hypothetical protein SBA4_4650013 [Candidatus Sulfopaludibacter sp. SbA4]
MRRSDAAAQGLQEGGIVHDADIAGSTKSHNRLLVEMGVKRTDHGGGSGDGCFDYGLVFRIFDDRWQRLGRNLLSDTSEELTVRADFFVCEWPTGANAVTAQDVGNFTEEISGYKECVLLAFFDQVQDCPRRTLRRDCRPYEEVGIEENSHRGPCRTSSHTSSTSFSISSAGPPAFADIRSRWSFS